MSSSSTSLEEILKQRGMLIYTNKGKSMFPLIKEGKDVLVISAQTENIKPFDVILTKRPSGRYILHRIIKKNKDGTFVICGDNSYKCDTGIKSTDIIGKLTTIIRGDNRNDLNSFFYRSYVYIWCRFFLIRKPVLRLMKIFL